MRIRRNVILNLVGFVVPVAVIFLAYPPLLRSLGTDRFGVFTLAMSLAAALSFLDFGLSAASIRFVSSDLHRGEVHDAGKVVTAALAFFAGLGLFISCVVFVLAPWMVDWFKVSESLQDEAIVVFRLTALQIAFSLLIGTLVGLFKAFDRFDLATVLASVLSVLTYGLPAVQISLMGHNLPVALITAVFMLTILSAIGVWIMNGLMKERGVSLAQCLPDVRAIKRIFGFGVALTLHALVGMLFTHGQRLLVAFLFGPASLTAYQLALTLVSKVHAGINAATEVVLPIASRGDGEQINALYRRGQLLTFVMAGGPLLVIGFFADTLITLWMGSAAPSQTAELLPLLCGAYFFVSLSAMPYHILNGFGFPLANALFAIANVAIFGGGAWIQKVFFDLELWHIALWYFISNMLVGIVYQVYCTSKILSSVSAGAASHKQGFGGAV